MALHATRDVDDAIAATRAFLTPVGARRWLKLAVVVSFVGGGTWFPTSGFNAPSNVPPGITPPELPSNVLFLAALVILAGLGLWLVFGTIGAIMEFVFVESLRSGDVRIRASWGEWWPSGLRLFGFRVLVGLPLLAVVLGAIGLVYAPLLLGLPPAVPPFVALLVGVPVFLVVGVIVGLVDGFTTAFIVPIMLLEGCGVLDGWRRLWPSIRAEVKEFLAYAVISFVLTLVGGFVLMLGLGFVALLLAVPLVGVGFGVSQVVSLSSPVGIGIVAVLVLVFAVVMTATWAAVKILIQTYLRYYALLFLGDVEADFDVIPDRRAAVRDE